MHRSLGILVTGLFVSASCLAQGALVGTYKLVSIKAEIDGRLRDDRTKPPHGYLMITPKYYAVFYTLQDRRFGTSDADKAALWESSDGAYEDHKYTCTACGSVYWVDDRATVSNFGRGAAKGNGSRARFCAARLSRLPGHAERDR